MANDAQTPAVNLNVPFHVFLGESIDVARFVKKYFSSVTDEAGKMVRPGLETSRGKVTLETSQTLRDLTEATQKADHDYRMIIDSSDNSDMRERADFLLSEVTGVLEFWFDDGVEDENDERLERLADVHGATGDSLDAKALELEDYCGMAKPLASELHGLGGFDSALIDEGFTVAKALREIPASPPAMSDEARKARAARDEKLKTLYDTVRQVRRVARFVFRNHPDIAREATSVWQRRTRAAQRLAAAQKAAQKAAQGQ